MIKSGSMFSLDSLNLSNHHTVNLEPPQRTRASSIVSNFYAHDEADNIDASNSSIFQHAGFLPRRPSLIFNAIMGDEAAKAVSCELIEMNLISDANRRGEEEETSQEYHVKSNQDDVDECYWDEPSDCDNIVENNDGHNVVLSTGQVETLLIEDALRRIEEAKEQYQSSMVVESDSADADYWEWHSEQHQPVLESEKKSHMITSIIFKESIRNMLSIDNITDIETRAKSIVQQQQRDLVVSHIESDTTSAQYSTDYWSWNNDDFPEEKENIDDDNLVVAPHVHDPTHPKHSYWDFPSIPNDVECVKQNLIQSILMDERIRALLSSESIEAREVNFHRSRKEMNSIDCIDAPVHALEKAPLNYWDFDAVDKDDLLTILAQEKEALIEKILREEKERYVVSTENIVYNLHNNNMEEEVERELASPSTASYWDW
jgi:hypothetical protein